MTDVRTEIPALAYVNAQIIQEANRMGSLDEPIRQVEINYGLPVGSLRILNPAHLIGLLYCLIVVPKELWLKNDAHPIFEQIDPKRLLAFVSVLEGAKVFDKSPAYSLLRHLRNAIAHARFELIEDNFIFWDQDLKSDRETFRATLSLQKLSEFVSYVGPVLANLRNRRLQIH